MIISPIHLVHAYLRQVTQKRILGGPFQGLYYVGESVGSSYFPKILGTYEKELHPILEAHRSEKFDKIVVIGAGEGYYAVGFAKKWKRPVLAFEVDPKGRELITRLALINKTTVFVKGKFETDLDTQSNKDLIFMDVEGAEKEILTPERFLEWKSSTLIVEVHSEAIKGLLLERSKYTHHSNFFRVVPREMNDYPFQPPFRRLLKRWWWACLQEWRSDSVGWLIFEPKS
jgi:hypothetical protein